MGNEKEQKVYWKLFLDDYIISVKLILFRQSQSQTFQNPFSQLLRRLKVRCRKL
jgi:hypothetical protein